MEKLFYETPVIDVTEVFIESGFAASTQGYDNENQNSW